MNAQHSLFPPLKNQLIPQYSYGMLGNNNNNNKTSIAPIYLKIIELSGAPSTGVGQTYIPDTMQSSSTNDQMEWKPRKDR